MNHLESVEHFEDHGKVGTGCGHRVDVRKLVYVHQMVRGREVGIDTMCPACSAVLALYIHPSDGRRLTDLDHGVPEQSFSTLNEVKP